MKMEDSTEKRSAHDVSAVEIRSDYGLFFLGILAILVVQTFRATYHPWIPFLWLETVILLLIPIALKNFLSQKFLHSLTISDKGSTRRLQLALLAHGGLVILFQWIGQSFGVGDANEIITLLVIQHVTWFLAVFSFAKSFGKFAFVGFNSLILFVCFIAEDTRTNVMAVFFWTSSLWILISNYWKKIDAKSLDGNCQMLPVKGIFFSVTILVLIPIVTLGYTATPEPVLRGIMALLPFSGGDRGFEGRFARSGVGNGRQLTAGENATTTGPVESDNFIEDDKPSLYDVVTEKFDGPLVKKKDQNRAISLAAKAKHLHDAKVMEEAGRKFRTFRNAPTSVVEDDLDSKLAKALFYLQGPLPTRLAVDYFYRFDGWDWSSDEATSNHHLAPSIEIEKELEKPWFVLRDTHRPIPGRSEFHQIKILRLQSQELPSPPLLEAWQIPDADKANLFRWNERGMIEFDSGTIPEHTVINLGSRLPNFGLLDKPFHVAISAPETNNTISRECRTRLKELLEKWTDRIPPGWEQINTIVGRLRNEFAHDPLSVNDPSGKDAIIQFLDRKRGPSYLFATTAVMLLREAGYQSRLASGFVITNADYVPKLESSVVTADNFHFWPEVKLRGNLWIPLEPTPGFPHPRGARTLWQNISSSVVAVFNWLANNPLFAVSALVLLVVIVRFRLVITDSAIYLAWSFFCIFWPKHSLSATRKFIDFRFRMAGQPRPPHQTVHFWYSRGFPNLESDFFQLWQHSNYSESLESSSTSEIRLACQRLVDSLTLRRIVAASKSQPSGTAQI